MPATDSTASLASSTFALRAALCILYGTGIIGFLVIYGILQERIMSIPYGGEMFTFSVFLVFCNRAVAVIFSITMIMIMGETKLNQAPLWKYFAVSVSNVYATTCQYEALKYVTFPVQMLGKSFKMMPVMIWGIIISQKQYGLRDWSIAAAVTGGVTMFLLTGDLSAEHAHHSHASIYGLLLLLAFLALDGFTSTFQEKLFKEHNTTRYNQMLYINIGSCTISMITLLATNMLMPAIGFLGEHPEIIGHALELSAAAVAGQWCIYGMVKDFGALVFAATMNVRQVVSILISYVKYGHVITTLQVVALFIVFSALFYKSFSGFLMSKEKEPGPNEKDGLLAKKNDDAVIANVNAADATSQKPADP